MKTKHPLTAKFLSSLSAGLILAAGAAGAQTYSYFYGENVQGGGYDLVSALPSGFDMEQYNEGTGVKSSGATASGIAPDAPTFGVQGFSAVVDLGGGWGQSFATPGYVEVIDSVTIYLWTSALQPNDGTETYQLYYGLDGRSGGAVTGSTITLSEDDDELKFVAFDIPVDVALAGFSIGHSGNNGAILWNTVTEDGLTASERPGFSVTTHLEAIPEPSVALLGVASFLALFRRRRR